MLLWVPGQCQYSKMALANDSQEPVLFHEGLLQEGLAVRSGHMVTSPLL
jgi:hypothetical protein